MQLASRAVWATGHVVAAAHRVFVRAAPLAVNRKFGATHCACGTDLRRWGRRRRRQRNRGAVGQPAEAERVKQERETKSVLERMQLNLQQGIPWLETIAVGGAIFSANEWSGFQHGVPTCATAQYPVDTQYYPMTPAQSVQSKHNSMPVNQGEFSQKPVRVRDVPVSQLVSDGLATIFDHVA